MIKKEGGGAIPDSPFLSRLRKVALVLFLLAFSRKSSRSAETRSILQNGHPLRKMLYNAEERIIQHFSPVIPF